MLAKQIRHPGWGESSGFRGESLAREGGLPGGESRTSGTQESTRSSFPPHNVLYRMAWGGVKSSHQLVGEKNRSPVILTTYPTQVRIR